MVLSVLAAKNRFVITFLEGKKRLNCDDAVSAWVLIPSSNHSIIFFLIVWFLLFQKKQTIIIKIIATR
jgi:hypothetical protein